MRTITGMPVFSSNFRGFPHWVSADYAALLNLPDGKLEWLLDNSSLTQRIKNFCCHSGTGDFSVRVLSQGKTMPSADEAKRLKLKSRRYALVREVLLFCGRLPLVYARTVIPLKTLTGRQKQLAYLGDKPLGAFLFAQSCLQRDVMELAVLTQGHQIFESASRALPYPPQQIWGRRSVFRLKNKPLLVTEVFLPTLLNE